MVFLLTFSQYISIPILSEWLNGKELILLDTSLCNTRYRPTFIELFRSHHTKFQSLVFSANIPCPLMLSIANWAEVRQISNFGLNIQVCNDMLMDWMTPEASKRLKTYLNGCIAMHLKRVANETVSILESNFSCLNNLVSAVYSDADGPMNIRAMNFALCSKLTSCNFSLSHTLTSESIIAICRNCVYLSELNLFRCNRVDDRVISAVLVHSRSLRLLDIFGCYSVTERAISMLSAMHRGGQFEFRAVHTLNTLRNYLWKNSGLTRLDVSELMFVNSIITNLIAQSCKGLQVLILNRCSRITDDEICVLVTSLPCLRVLDIQSLKVITDTALECINTYCAGIEELRLYANVRLTQSGLKSIGTGTTRNLTSLTMKSLMFLTRDVLSAILSNCNRLKYLDISGSAGFSNEALIALVPLFSKLTELNLKFCIHISDDTKDLLSKHCKVIR